jgi:uncharacterized protein YkwD
VPRTWTLVAVCLAFLTLVVPSARADPREALLTELAELRGSHGLAPLRHSPALAAAARRHAGAMMRSDGFVHAVDLIAPGFASGGEVMARQRGWSLRLGPVIRMWMRSDMHRGLLLDPGFTDAGVGWRRGRFAGRLTTLWVVRLGRRAAPAPPA